MDDDVYFYNEKKKWKQNWQISEYVFRFVFGDLWSIFKSSMLNVIYKTLNCCDSFCTVATSFVERIKNMAQPGWFNLNNSVILLNALKIIDSLSNSTIQNRINENCTGAILQMLKWWSLYSFLHPSHACYAQQKRDK